jgi:hypothetical protein
VDIVNMDIVNMDTVNMDTVNMDIVNMDTVNMDIVNMDIVNTDTVNMDTVNMDIVNTPFRAINSCKVQLALWFCALRSVIPWAGYLSRYSDWLRAGRYGDRIPVGARFSAPVQTGPGALPASCTMGTGSFPGVESGRGVRRPLTPFYCRGLKTE